MEEKIERILVGELHCLNNEDELKPYLRMKAAEIAKLVEDKEAELTTNRKALANTLTFLSQAEAQLAMMRGALEHWNTTYEKYEGMPPYNTSPLQAGSLHLYDAWKQAKKALSAAPEVLASFEGRWREDDPYSYTNLTIMTLEPFGNGKLVIRTRIGGSLDDWDGQQVKVIVVRQRDHEEPKP